MLSLLCAALVQSHLTLLLSKGKIFDRLWPKWLTELRNCPMCLGFWTAGTVAILWTGWQTWLIIAALGHIIYLAREKYLPCTACSNFPPPSTGNIYLPKA